MNQLNFHYLQHVSFEYPGYIEDWIKINGHKLTGTKLYLNEKLPNHDEYDALIIMGGPMGVYDEDKYSWLVSEKKFVKEAITLQKKIIGICLGSQLLADSMGARVYPNREKEIGFFPVSFRSNNNTFFEHLPDSGIAFHWHSDTYDLPDGAKLLASSETCTNQAFLSGNNILGLQFHFEITESLIQGLLKHCKNDLNSQKYVQSENDIIKGFKYIPACNLLLEKLLNKFFKTNE